MVAVLPQTAELEAKLQTAVTHHRAGRLSEAQRLYRDILQFLPDHPVVNNSLGIALKGDGKSAEAEVVFRGSRRLHPTMRRRTATSATFCSSRASLPRLKHPIARRLRRSPIWSMHSRTSVWSLSIAVALQKASHGSGVTPSWLMADRTQLRRLFHTRPSTTRSSANTSSRSRAWRRRCFVSKKAPGSRGKPSIPMRLKVKLHSAGA